MRIFLAGIIQGSHQGSGMHDQDYREELKMVIRERLPEAEIVCPIDLHPNGVTYGLAEAGEVFFAMVERAVEADALVAYLPEASMGTAIEMWEAHRAGRPVFTITPLHRNWVVNLLSDRVFPSLADFRAFLAEGGLESAVAYRRDSGGVIPAPAPRGEHA